MKKVIFQQEIYTYDIDSSRHVSNIVYIKWMEIGRNRLSEEAGLPLHKLEALDFAPVLTKTEIVYKKPLYLGDKVQIELYLTDLRKISGTIKFNFLNQNDELVAEGEQKALFFNLNTKKPHKLSKEHWSMFAEYLNEE